MTPGDDLAARVKNYVSTQVPADQVDVVTRTVCMVVVTLMADPYFTNNLRVVNELRQENAWLKNQNAILATAMASRQPAKKPVVKKAARKRAPARSQKQAFQQGVRDLRR